MSLKTKAELTLEAQQKIRDETVANSITKQDVYDILKNIIDSTFNEVEGGATGTGFSDWDASVDAMPVNADAIGSGEDGAIKKGDRVIFTTGGTINGEFWPVDTIGTAKQDSPTLDTHWRLI